MRIESSEFAQSLLKEYERPALQKKKGPNSSNLSTQVEAGSPCPVDGCKGTMSLVPSGFPRRPGNLTVPSLDAPNSNLIQSEPNGTV